jgi:hypothetical protein
MHSIAFIDLRNNSVPTVQVKGEQNARIKHAISAISACILSSLLFSTTTKKTKKMKVFLYLFSFAFFFFSFTPSFLSPSDTAR